MVSQPIIKCLLIDHIVLGSIRQMIFILDFFSFKYITLCNTLTCELRTSLDNPEQQIQCGLELQYDLNNHLALRCLWAQVSVASSRTPDSSYIPLSHEVLSAGTTYRYRIIPTQRLQPGNSLAVYKAMENEVAAT